MCDSRDDAIVTGVAPAGRGRPALFGSYLALVMAIGPLVHYSLTALGPLLVEQFELTATEFGLLWFVSFAFAGAFSIASGTMSDRFSARYMLGGTFALATLALLVAGGASSFAWLIAVAVLSGLAQSVSNPATNAIVATTVPPRQQGLVLGIKQSGVQMSQLFAGISLPSIALLLGWRAALFTCAVIGVIGLILTWRVVPRGAPVGQQGGFRSRPRLGRGVWWLTAYVFLMGAVTQATNVYLPLYAYRVLDVSAIKAGLIVAALGGIGVVARLAWGRIADRTDDMQLSLLLLAVLACLALVAFVLAATAGEWLMWLGIGLFSLSALAANVIIMLTIVRTSHPDAIGHASGWASLGLYAGFMVGPLSFGHIVDTTVGFTTAWIAALAVAALLVVLAVALRYGLDGSDRRRRVEREEGIR